MKKKVTKKFASVLLVALIVLAAIPFVAFFEKNRVEAYYIDDAVTLCYTLSLNVSSRKPDPETFWECMGHLLYGQPN